MDDEDKLYEWTRSDLFTYTKQLEVIEELLELRRSNMEEDDVTTVINRLGRDVSAQQAVPSAIYCFLRNLEKGFEETLYYAISLGGDTDTIGTMCTAMAGAYYGYSELPSRWVKYSEGSEDMRNYSDRFYDKHS